MNKIINILKFYKVALTIVIIVGFFWYIKNKDNKINNNYLIQNNNIKEDFAFKNKGFNTKTSKSSIVLDHVLDGGPGKDGIPALKNPAFVSIKDAKKDIAEDVDGVVVSVGSTTKFYPFNIMVWHEIVNDVVEGKPLVVTFCPLCSSSIVFEAQIAGVVEDFGVSGMLYESNLLMYDKSTESLWSQAVGTAVVGDRNGEKLVIYPSQRMSFGDFKNKWPNGQVLSKKTGHVRNYDFYPYRNYDDSEDIFFPVSVKDTRFPAKEIMYVVNAYGHSLAFPFKQLKEEVLSVSVGGKVVTAATIDGEVIAKDAAGKTLPGYHEMWFSWATQHQKDGIVKK